MSAIAIVFTMLRCLRHVAEKLGRSLGDRNLKIKRKEAKSPGMDEENRSKSCATACSSVFHGREKSRRDYSVILVKYGRTNHRPFFGQRRTWQGALLVGDGAHVRKLLTFSNQPPMACPGGFHELSGGRLQRVSIRSP